MSGRKGRDPRLQANYRTEAYKRQMKDSRERANRARRAASGGSSFADSGVPGADGSFDFKLDGSDAHGGVTWNETVRAGGPPTYHAHREQQPQDDDGKDERRDEASHMAVDMRTHDPLLSERLITATAAGADPHPLLTSGASTALALTSAPALAHPNVVNEASDAVGQDAQAHHMPSDLVQHLVTRPAHPRDQHMRSPRKNAVVTRAKYLVPQSKKGATPSRSEDPYDSTTRPTAHEQREQERGSHYARTSPVRVRATMGTLVTKGTHGATAAKLLGGVAAFSTAGGKVSSPIFAPKYDNGLSTKPGKFEKPTDATEHGMEWFDGRQTARKLVKDWEEMRTDTNTELAALHVVLGRFRKLLLKNSSAAGGAGGDDTSSNTVKVIEIVLKDVLAALRIMGQAFSAQHGHLDAVLLDVVNFISKQSREHGELLDRVRQQMVEWLSEASTATATLVEGLAGTEARSESAVHAFRTTEAQLDGAERTIWRQRQEMDVLHGDIKDLKQEIEDQHMEFVKLLNKQQRRMGAARSLQRTFRREWPKMLRRRIRNFRAAAKIQSLYRGAYVRQSLAGALGAHHTSYKATTLIVKFARRWLHNRRVQASLERHALERYCAVVIQCAHRSKVAYQRYLQAIDNNRHHVELDRLRRELQGIKHIVRDIEAAVHRKGEGEGEGEGDIKAGLGTNGKDGDEGNDEDEDKDEEVTADADNMRRHMQELRDKLEVIESVTKMHLDLMTSRERTMELLKQGIDPDAQQQTYRRRRKKPSQADRRQSMSLNNKVGSRVSNLMAIANKTSSIQRSPSQSPRNRGSSANLANTRRPSIGSSAFFNADAGSRPESANSRASETSPGPVNRQLSRDYSHDASSLGDGGWEQASDGGSASRMSLGESTRAGGSRTTLEPNGIQRAGSRMSSSGRPGGGGAGGSKRRLTKNSRSAMGPVQSHTAELRKFRAGVRAVDLVNAGKGLMAIKEIIGNVKEANLPAAEFDMIGGLKACKCQALVERVTLFDKMKKRELRHGRWLDRLAANTYRQMIPTIFPVASNKAGHSKPHAMGSNAQANTQWTLVVTQAPVGALGEVPNPMEPLNPSVQTVVNDGRYGTVPLEWSASGLLCVDPAASLHRHLLREFGLPTIVDQLMVDLAYYATECEESHPEARLLIELMGDRTPAPGLPFIIMLRTWLHELTFVVCRKTRAKNMDHRSSEATGRGRYKHGDLLLDISEAAADGHVLGQGEGEGERILNELEDDESREEVLDGDGARGGRDGDGDGEGGEDGDGAREGVGGAAGMGLLTIQGRQTASPGPPNTPGYGGVGANSRGREQSAGSSRRNSGGLDIWHGVANVNTTESGQSTTQPSDDTPDAAKGKARGTLELDREYVSVLHALVVLTAMARCPDGHAVRLAELVCLGKLNPETDLATTSDEMYTRVVGLLLELAAGDDAVVLEVAPHEVEGADAARRGLAKLTAGQISQMEHARIVGSSAERNLLKSTMFAFFRCDELQHYERVLVPIASFTRYCLAEHQRQSFRFQHLFWAQAAFKAGDKDFDGKLTREEFTEAVEPILELIVEDPDNPDGGGGAEAGGAAAVAAAVDGDESEGAPGKDKGDPSSPSPFSTPGGDLRGLLDLESEGEVGAGLVPAPAKWRRKLIHRTFEHALYLSGLPQMEFTAFHQATAELWEKTGDPLLSIIAMNSEDLAADLITRL